jgi:hypothetical protein
MIGDIANLIDRLKFRSSQQYFQNSTVNSLHPGSVQKISSNVSQA